jgi:hypothetical protein
MPFIEAERRRHGDDGDQPGERHDHREQICGRAAFLRLPKNCGPTEYPIGNRKQIKERPAQLVGKLRLREDADADSRSSDPTTDPNPTPL